jgi:hypothetical protein
VGAKFELIGGFLDAILCECDDIEGDLNAIFVIP